MMKTKTTSHNYTEWFAAEEMNEHSKKWFSELSFITDEQQFLTNLIRSFAVKPLDKKEFEQLDDFKKAIEQNRHRLNVIIKQVQKHMNQLEIMMDDVNQLDMEQAYKKTHRNLSTRVNKYLLDYRTVKERGFAKLSSILKTGKQKIALGNPEYNVGTTAGSKKEPYTPEFGFE